MTRIPIARAAVAAVLGVVVVATASCASRAGHRNDTGARVVGGHLRPAVTQGEMGSSARRAIHGAAVGGGGGAAIGLRMDLQAEDLANDLRFARVWRVGEGIAVVLDSGLLFDLESSALVPDINDGLRGLVHSLRGETRTHILVLGHTDSFAADSYNQMLSERRGQAVGDYLRTQGIAESRLVMRGKGAREPISSNETSRGRLENRRIEVAIYADDDWRRSAR
jgi:outer membrane protein OmpA-like peptidoglycan-associated protein